MGLIDNALAVGRARDAHRKPIDYERMKKLHPQQKAALTRAVRSGDPEKVAAACKKAVQEWNEIGAWPDDWNLWQISLNDMLPWSQSIQLEDL